MPAPAPADPRRALVALFDALAPTYDALGFLPAAAVRLATLAGLTPGQRVLDVATGTGALAQAAAAAVGPTGRVVGIDLSPAMAVRARARLASTPQAEVRVGDAARLEEPAGTFDAVLCASALPFIRDMAGALAEWRRVLVPGGRAGFSSFGPGFLQPLRDLWAARLQAHGLEPRQLPFARLSDAATCQALLGAAGFEAIEVKEEQLGYRIPTAEERWREIVAGAEGLPLAALPPEQRGALEREHLEELRPLAKEGLWIDVPAIFALARAG